MFGFIGSFNIHRAEVIQIPLKKEKTLYHRMYALTGKYILKEAFS